MRELLQLKEEARRLEQVSEQNMKKNFMLEKVYHEFQQGGGFFQCAVWVRQITRVLQTCIVRRSKVQMVIYITDVKTLASAGS